MENQTYHEQSFKRVQRMPSERLPCKSGFVDRKVGEMSVGHQIRWIQQFHLFLIARKKEVLPFRSASTVYFGTLLKQVVNSNKIIFIVVAVVQVRPN